MNSHSSASDLSVLSSDAVDYTMSSLARHMGQCQQAQGRWFGLRVKAEFAHAVVASRIVTSAALAALCCWAVMSFA